MSAAPRPTAPSDGSRWDSGDRNGDAGVLGPLCVSPANCAAWWPHAEEIIAAALRRGNGGTPLAEVRGDVLGGRALLWIAWSPADEVIVGAAVTALVLQGDERRCELVAFAGDFARCRAFLPRLEQFAREEGCGAMRIIGRTGWRRRLTDYAEPFVVLEKRL